MTEPISPLLAAVEVGALDGVDAGLLLIRVAIGLTLFAHGYNKFAGGLSGAAGWFSSMGMKPNGRVHAIVAASTEVGSGLLIAAGLLTPFAAAGFVGVMLVAAWTVHRPNGFFIVKDGWEYNMILAVVAVGIASTGPGAYSLDDLIGLDDVFSPVVSLAIAVGLGLITSIGLLTFLWKPEPAEPASEADAT